MSGTRLGSALRQIGRLFDEGTMTGLADSELLDRFLGRGDGIAFRTLIERHGSMVLSVCRAILGNGPHVEDAFQATFLVLIRKAPTIRGRGALGAWLHRVAYRVAVASSIAETRRRKRERALGDDSEDLAARPVETFDDRDRLATVHDEVARLPEKFRRPIVLCYLEGKPHAQAAAELGCGEATLRRRLSSARDLLRSRLTRRGLAPAVGVAMIEALAREASAAIPPSWINPLVNAASLPAGALITTANLSATAVRLARSVSTTFLIGKLQGLAAVGSALIAFGLIGLHTIPTGLAQTGDKSEVQKKAPTTKKVASPLPAPKPAPTPPEDRSQSFTFSGIVLDPDGKPFTGAKITLEGTGVKDAANPPVRTISGADGRFRFECPATDFVPGSGWPIPMGSSAVARAEGFALGAANYAGANESLTLRLALDNVPIQGRIVDPEGKPIPGVSVSVRGIRESQSGDLTEWLKGLAPQNSNTPKPALDRKPFPLSILQGDHPLFPPVATDQDGRFEISGIGRERVAELRIEGPTIETAVIMVRTRPGPTIETSDKPRFWRTTQRGVLYGASFSDKALPSRPIEGIVRDRESGRPLAGINIRSEYPSISETDFVSAITNAEGRYRLTGLPIDQPVTLLATAPCDRIIDMRGTPRRELPDESLPYMRSTTRFPGADPKSKEPIRLDFKLQRGVWATGRVLDKTTGQPVRARVSYVAYQDNPMLLKLGIASFQGNEYGQDTTADGSFRLAVFPGPGLIGARTYLSTDYVMGVGAESIPRLVESLKKKGSGYPGAPLSFRPEFFNTMAEINPKPTDQAIEINLPFNRGHVLRLETIDSEGKPQDVDAVSGLDDRAFWDTNKGPRSDFSIMKLVPGKKRIVTARNANKALIGQVEIDGKEERPARLTLVPWGEITGRLVFPEGQAQLEEIQILSQRNDLETPAPWLMRINKDGTFRIEGLVPGRPYSFLMANRQGRRIGDLNQGITVKPGEVKDLGDVVVKPTK